ncbi:unnamed protein product (macronuclear) [Paramecium tetraurelia]|uniref:non-specific serine/threonine protein kinase n=1 Tax=Paramecium tetraurelia TaxID=5888 RepID=A0CTB6_PARTE|nr:uncharacterized protein GSPATT00010267001 [Paramecium tetraurelia]CAK74033.1 unnamed protein product [Paramecium tetraurelia]|eukprot:XP_001441430.1 hypothetical protein (macronuclear) [Paramecium tetraurelia strain d4-2]
MGANSSQSEKFVQEFQRQCVKVRELKDLRFGDVQIYRTQQNTFIMVKSIWCNNSSEYDASISNCEKRSKIQHQNLVKLLGYHSNSQNQWCGDFSKITVYLEFFDYTLEKSIETRRQTNQYFTEAELWKMLFTIAKLGIYLEEQNKVLGDIRPCNIQLSDDLKMAELGILKPDQTGYQRQINNQEIAYLSPEQLYSINNPSITAKSDVFSLGVTMLECSTLMSGKNLYKSNRIDGHFLQQLLETVKQLGYSNPWYRMVRELLKEQPDERPSYQDIYDALKQFEVQILNLQPFSLLYQQPQLPQQSISPYRPQHQQYSQSLPPPHLQQQQPQTQVPMQFQQFQQQQQQPQQQQQIVQPQQIQSLPQQPPFQYQQQVPSQQPILASQLPSQQPQQQQPLPQNQFPPQQSYMYSYQQQQPYLNELANAQSNYFVQQPVHHVPQQIEQSPYHTLQSPQNMTSTMYYQEEEQDDGLNEIDRKIQQALKMTRDTEMRNKQTPNYY